jgi:hypothetical protein
MFNADFLGSPLSKPRTTQKTLKASSSSREEIVVIWPYIGSTFVGSPRTLKPHPFSHGTPTTSTAGFIRVTKMASIATEASTAGFITDASKLDDIDDETGTGR